ncbi:MAG: GNAT family N-acetyltransferase, partial [Bacillota bacterium]
AYLSSDAPPAKPGPGVTLRVLEPEHLEFVLTQYSHPTDRAYVASRIAEGMLGAYVDGRLAGFIGTHAEGTMGMLEVLPEYRRMGLAYTLEAALIGRQLARGYVPHAQIVCDNTPSLRLQEKLGMTFSEQPLVWLFND